MSVSQPHIVEPPASRAARDLRALQASLVDDRGTPSSGVGQPLVYGLLGALALAALYLGLVAWAESWIHAWDLFLEDAPLVVPIVLGFGTQVGLCTYLRRVRQPAGGLGTSQASEVAAPNTPLTSPAHAPTPARAVKSAGPPSPTPGRTARSPYCS